MIMEKKEYKAVNFDLDVKKLKQYYTNSKGEHSKNYRRAYRDIKMFMYRNGFSHKQGSGYRSDEKITDTKVQNLLSAMTEEYPWIIKSVKSFDVTDIKAFYDCAGYIKAFDSLYNDCIERQRKKAAEKEHSAASLIYNAEKRAAEIAKVQNTILSENTQKQADKIKKSASLFLENKSTER